MKLIRLIYITIIALSFFACSDDDENWNKANVSVGFKDIVIDSTQRSLFYVPISITGISDGNIELEVQVKNSNATEDKQFIITDKTLRIGAGKSEINLEIAIPTNDERPEILDIDLEIINVKHASLDQARKNVNLSLEMTAYDRLIGTYQATATNLENRPEKVTFTFRISEGAWGSYFWITGWDGYSMPFMLYFNGDAQKVSFPGDQYSPGSGSYQGIATIAMMIVINPETGKGALRPLEGTWNEDFSEITLDQTVGLIVAEMTMTAIPIPIFGHYLGDIEVKKVTTPQTKAVEFQPPMLLDREIPEGLMEEVKEHLGLKQ